MTATKSNIPSGASASWLMSVVLSTLTSNVLPCPWAAFIVNPYPPLAQLESNPAGDVSAHVSIRVFNSMPSCASATDESCNASSVVNFGATTLPVSCTK